MTLKYAPQTAKNTLPKTKITLLRPKLRFQKPRLRSLNQDYAPENLNYAPKNQDYAPETQITLPKTKITLLKLKLRSQKPRLRSWQPKLRSQKPRLRSQKNISGNWIAELPAFCTYEPYSLSCLFRYNAVFSEASFKSYSFRMRAKADTYNDETRVKHSVVAVDNMDYTALNKYEQQIVDFI